MHLKFYSNDVIFFCFASLNIFFVWHILWERTLLLSSAYKKHEYRIVAHIELIKNKTYIKICSEIIQTTLFKLLKGKFNFFY